uniref:Coagulation factor IX [Myotis lucifugus] n=1 Tax=Lepeophtheirus salmonis TaxID=72036 RepID=A0A0K2U095_LEPSM
MMKLFCAILLSIAFLQSSSAEYEDICGIENKEFSSKIIGGQEAEPNQFPWVVAILMSSIFGSGRCTGSIVNKQYILTASHCVAQFDRFTISAGTHDYSKDEPHQQIMLATESIPHPNFTNNMFEYHDDIALIKLEKELEFNGNLLYLFYSKNDDVNCRLC